MFKRVGKPVVFIVVVLLAALTYLAAFGIQTTNGDSKVSIIKGAQDIRFGIDIRGGVDVTFSPPKGKSVTKADMDAATAIITTRLDSQNITDNVLYTDYTNHQIIVQFPWKSGETNFDPESAIKELGATALLTFKATDGTVLLTGSDVKSAKAAVTSTGSGYEVDLTFKDSGTKKFADATTKYLNKEIDIYMDSKKISSPVVQTVISNGSCTISNDANPMTVTEATELANQINGGALPFKLETNNFSTISPSLGSNALNVMLLAGCVAFIIICLFMILYYRLPGFIACLALTGHVAGTLLAISIPQFTLTLPGIAGIILSIGMGVDCNIITAERIKEELRVGKTLDGAIDAGFERSFTAIFDGNITVLIVGTILWFLGSSAVKSFGYTLIIGVVFNFLMGIIASRLMLKSVSKFGFARRDVLYSGRAAK